MVSEFDVQLRLILADEKEWAVEKASTIGRLEETSFKNSKDQLITWKFIGVTEISLLGDLDDTLLVHSESESPENINEYRRSIKTKMLQVGTHPENIGAN